MENSAFSQIFYGNSQKSGWVTKSYHAYWSVPILKAKTSNQIEKTMTWIFEPFLNTQYIDVWSYISQKSVNFTHDKCSVENPERDCGAGGGEGGMGGGPKTALQFLNNILFLEFQDLQHLQ